jgi:HAD superfamily hydrolase (TIGR01549 family)
MNDDQAKSNRQPKDQTDRLVWVVLFDWDGTLINSLDIKVHNAGELFEQALGLSRREVESAYRRHSGIPRRPLFDAICRETGHPPLEEGLYAQLSARFSHSNRQALTQAALDPESRRQLLPMDTIETLKALHEKGYPLYISSSADTKEIEAIAQVLGLAEYFQEILGSQPGFTKGKDHAEFVMQRSNLRREQLVFVGDEPTDIALGRQAGVLTIAKAGTYPASILEQAGPDYIVQSLIEVIPILSAIQPSRNKNA